MPHPIFELFETVAGELAAVPSTVFTHHNLQNNGQNTPLLDALLKSIKGSTVTDAIPLAVDQLAAHFAARDASLPFTFQRNTGTFTATNANYISFINTMQSIRGLGTRSKDFECTVAQRLSARATGAIHRVGHPRQLKKTNARFNAHLKTLGFARRVLNGRDKDGGFDILWLLPLGAIPHSPIVSVQCKNGEFNFDSAHISLGTAGSSLTCHAGLHPGVHVPCVLFNDYILRDMLGEKPTVFVPLGLTDLAPLKNPVAVTCI